LTNLLKLFMINDTNKDANNANIKER